MPPTSNKEVRASNSTTSAVSAPPERTRWPSAAAATSMVSGSVLGWNTSRRLLAKCAVFAASSPSSCACVTRSLACAPVGRMTCNFYKRPTESWQCDTVLYST